MHNDGSFGNGTTVWFVVQDGHGHIGLQSSSKPKCATQDCIGEPVVRDTNASGVAVVLCIPCHNKLRRLKVIRSADQWMAASFVSCSTQEQRRKLYRSLASVFHPDSGGDRWESEELMKVLNKIKQDAGL